jgi:cupin fold WbuC family metalloprotein
MKLIEQQLLDGLATKASQSPRGRAHHNVHAGNEDPVQRFFVAVERHSYFRPHRHSTRAELAVVMRGGFDVLTFDDAGIVQGRWSVGDGQPNLAYETPLQTWHTLFAHRDGSVFLEVKEGPYDPATAVEFASWAPAEGDAAVPAYQAWLRGAQPGDRYGR